MKLALEGKVALVTGASRGIGAAVAAALACEGVNVFAVARSACDPVAIAPVSGVAAAGKVVPYQADLSRPEAFAPMIEAAIRTFGRLDIVSHNAGNTRPGDFLALDDEIWLEGFALKFHGARRLARAAWPHLRQSGGCIINTIGIMSRTAIADYAMGGAVNVALLHLTKALSQLGVADGVRVNAVNPGRIQTDRLDAALARISDEEGLSREEAARRLMQGSGIARFGTPQEIAAAVCFLASPQAGFVNGAILDIDGGQTRAV